MAYSNLTDFSKRSIWGQKTTSGFKQQVFIMYHSTKSAVRAAKILENGFNLSNGEDNMLGEGIYVAKDIEKAIPYGPITFKMLVYPGRIKRIDRQNHPEQKSWQNHYNSAWVPPNCGMVRSGLQENCIRNPDQIKILGVVRGYERLSYLAKEDTKDLTLYREDRLYAELGEPDILETFLKKQHLLYSAMWVEILHGGYNKRMYFVAVGDSVRLSQQLDTFNPNYRWTRSYDNCIENRASGKVWERDLERLGIALKSPVREKDNSNIFQKFWFESDGKLYEGCFAWPLIVNLRECCRGARDSKGLVAYPQTDEDPHEGDNKYNTIKWQWTY